MIRAAAIVAAVLALPTLAHAAPPGMTPPIGDTPPASDGPPSTYGPPSSYPVRTYAAPPPPSTYSPSPYPPAPSAYTPSPYPAPPAGAVAEQPASSGTPSYRALTIGADFLAVGMFAYAVDDNDDDLLTLSLGTYALGAPLVHLIKGRTGTALASVGMRLGFPLVGAMLGEALHTEPKCQVGYVEDCGFEQSPSDEAVLGLLVGIGTAMVVDSAYLARGDKPKAPPRPQWSPTLRASQGGFALGAAGTF